MLYIDKPMTKMLIIMPKLSLLLLPLLASTQVEIDKEDLYIHQGKIIMKKSLDLDCKKIVDPRGL
jgi:hypothetical protein